jgi:molybdopterin converting factor small subunit
MSIKINLHWHLWQELTNGQAMVEISGNTTGQCLKHLVRQFPALNKEIFEKDGELLGYLTIFINREPAFPEELTKPVKDGDEIHIVPLIVGG